MLLLWAIHYEGGVIVAVIQVNGDRHYETDHGTYVVISFWEPEFRGEINAKVWEIFAPIGMNFSSCHSLLELSLAEAKEHIGSAWENCDEECGCDYFLGEEDA